VGHFEESKCTKVSPIRCIIIDPNNIETHQQHLDKYNSLVS
ncbi:ferredoxin, partial [Francisella tularensis subsp. holarctica]|nr:ferredoxin [Francisella tularensis subsp. holarctica]